MACGSRIAERRKEIESGLSGWSIGLETLGYRPDAEPRDHFSFESVRLALFKMSAKVLTIIGGILL